jgi:hypothetical protein
MMDWFAIAIGKASMHCGRLLADDDGISGYAWAKRGEHEQWVLSVHEKGTGEG